jgi:toxin ParE1/3/4
MKPVRLQLAALNDLKDIGTFISGDSPTRAETFVREVEDRCRRLGAMPNAYPLLAGHAESGIRRCPFP